MAGTFKQLSTKTRVRWRGNRAPQVKLRCRSCGKHLITYVAPNVGHLGSVYVDIPNKGHIHRAGSNRFTIQCSKKGCTAEYTLAGDSLVRMVSAAALLSEQAIVVNEHIPSRTTLIALLRFFYMDRSERTYYAERVCS